MPSMVKWYFCVHCKAKFWWWLLPLRTGGKHKKNCPVLKKEIKPKFKRCKPPIKNNFKKTKKKVKNTGKTN